MCVSPVRIRNPNKNATSELMRILYDCDSDYINVPCNHCAECVASRQMQLVQRCEVMLADHYLFFCTLTYNSQSLPYVKCSNGVEIPYADISDLQKMFKRIRKANLFGRNFSYFFVTERGSEKGRPHVHGLIFIPKKQTDDKLLPAQLETSVRNVLFKEWRRNYGSNRVPIWKPLFTYRTKVVAGKVFRNFDCHYVVPHSTEKGSTDVSFYVTKYLLKPSDKEDRLQKALRLNLDEDEYNAVWSVVRSRCICSKFFGASSDYEIGLIKASIDKSCNNPEGFKFFSNGEAKPLARYYRKYITLEPALASAKARGSVYTCDERSQSEKDSSVAHGRMVQETISKHDLSELYPL